MQSGAGPPRMPNRRRTPRLVKHSPCEDEVPPPSLVGDPEESGWFGFGSAAHPPADGLYARLDGRRSGGCRTTGGGRRASEPSKFLQLLPLTSQKEVVSGRCSPLGRKGVEICSLGIGVTVVVGVRPGAPKCPCPYTSLSWRAWSKPTHLPLQYQ